MMRGCNGWSEFRNLLLGRSIVANNPSTGLVAISDGSILDLSMRSLHPVEAALMPYGFPMPDEVIQAVETSTYAAAGGGGPNTDLHVSVFDHARLKRKGYVLLKIKAPSDFSTGVSKFLLASHTRYVKGEALVRAAETDEGMHFS